MESAVKTPPFVHRQIDWKKRTYDLAGQANRGQDDDPTYGNDRNGRSNSQKTGNPKWTDSGTDIGLHDLTLAQKFAAIPLSDRDIGRSGDGEGGQEDRNGLPEAHIGRKSNVVGCSEGWVGVRKECAL